MIRVKQISYYAAVATSVNGWRKNVWNISGSAFRNVDQFPCKLGFNSRSVVG